MGDTETNRVKERERAFMSEETRRNGRVGTEKLVRNEGREG